MRQFRSLACFSLALLLALAPPSLTSFAASRVYHGIDVSEWQGDIDFEAVRQSGIDAVYIRAGEGSDYVDAYFESHYQGALAAGLKIGYYHYVTAQNEEEAREQARFFCSLIRGKTVDLYPAMDFESFPGLDVEEINVIGAAFIETLKDCLGYTPSLYSDTNNTASVWDSSFASYPLWVAEYGPAVPSNTGYWATWDGFQYSDAGNVPGISGQVDLDYFKDTMLINGGNDSGSPDTSATYTVRPGDTLWAIARRFGTTIEALVQANDIPDPNLIYPGQVLTIPGRGEMQATYTVRPGNTLWAIARRFGTTVQELVSLNGIADPNLIYPGQVLRLPDSSSVLVYRVVQGDTLSGIALRFGTTVQALVLANHIADPNLIDVGQTLVIPQ